MSPTAEQLLELYLRIDQALADIGPATAHDTATAIVSLTVASIEGAEQASISESRNGRLRTVASTGEMASAGDCLQYEFGHGPCVDALDRSSEALNRTVVYRSDDVGTDDRWPQFGRRAAADVGARSMMSFRLYLDNDPDRVAGLNVYSSRPSAFDASAQTVGTVLATQSARALLTAAARDKAANLAQALDSNREIGTAMGIVMAGHGVTREDAFALLRIASQNTNRKLIEIATEVVDTGVLEPPSVTQKPRHPPRPS